MKKVLAINVCILLFFMAVHNIVLQDSIKKHIDQRIEKLTRNMNRLPFRVGIDRVKSLGYKDTVCVSNVYYQRILTGSLSWAVKEVSKPKENGKGITLGKGQLK